MSTECEFRSCEGALAGPRSQWSVSPVTSRWSEPRPVWLPRPRPRGTTLPREAGWGWCSRLSGVTRWERGRGQRLALPPCLPTGGAVLSAPSEEGGRHQGLAAQKRQLGPADHSCARGGGSSVRGTRTSGPQAPALCRVTGRRCLPLTCVPPSFVLRGREPLEGPEWRTAQQKPGRHGPRAALPAGPLRREPGAGRGQRGGPPGGFRAARRPAQQAPLPVAVGAGRAGPLPVPVAPRRLQGLDCGPQAAVPQRRQLPPARGRPPGGRSQLTPWAPAGLGQQWLPGPQRGGAGPPLGSPPVPVAGAPGPRGLAAPAGPAAGPAAEPLPALRAPREEAPAEAPAGRGHSVAAPVLGLPEDDTGEASSCVPAAAPLAPPPHGAALGEGPSCAGPSAPTPTREGQPGVWSEPGRPGRSATQSPPPGPGTRWAFGGRVREAGSWARVSEAAPAPLQPRASRGPRTTSPAARSAGRARVWGPGCGPAQGRGCLGPAPPAPSL